MGLTGTSTLADALAQYNNNLSWEGDSAKAIAALEAVRWLLINRPQSGAGGDKRMDFASLEKEKEKLEAFVSVAGTTAASRRASFVRATARPI